MTHLFSPTHTTVAELLARWPQAARVFVRHRMACVGCAVAAFESVADVAAIYHLPADQFARELCRAIEGRGRDRRGAGRARAWVTAVAGARRRRKTGRGADR